MCGYCHLSNNRANSKCVHVRGLCSAFAWEMDNMSNMLEGCLTVLMTSLSVLTTEGWMMVAPQGTAVTGGLTDKILGRYLQSVGH